ncbi:MAG: hypothetical protein KBD37_04650 [Burkholderiales bacterium]|nr:hypothetical protein [Burkholderiales bacterium]
MNAFVYKKFTHLIEELPSLSDDQFLAWQILQLDFIFKHEIAAIKNISGEFLAFTQFFATEFNVTPDLLGKTGKFISPDFDVQIYEHVDVQEKFVINKLKPQRSLCIFRKNNIIMIYDMYKRPLVNPATNNVLGVHVIISKYIPNAIRQIIDKKLFKSHQYSINLANCTLSHLQNQIIFCLLLGYTTRKEITNILIYLTGTECSENRVKNALQALYEKFECNTPGQLIDLVISRQININIPAEIFPAGVFTFDE